MRLQNSTIDGLLIDCLDLIYPRLCVGCARTLLTQEKEICLVCLSELTRTGFHTRAKNNPIYDALAGLLPLSGAVSWLYYEQASLCQHLIHSMKYEGKAGIAQVLGQVFATELASAKPFPAETVVIPIPLHPFKLKSRGYNQAAVFARALSKGLTLPYDDKSLQRIRHTESQTGKDRNARRANMASAFQVYKPFSSPVLLVDDVATTGATLEAAGVALIKAGVTNIFIATIAFVPAG